MTGEGSASMFFGDTVDIVAKETRDAQKRGASVAETVALAAVLRGSFGASDAQVAECFRQVKIHRNSGPWLGSLLCRD